MKLFGTDDGTDEHPNATYTPHHQPYSGPFPHILETLTFGHSLTGPPPRAIEFFTVRTLNLD